MTDTRQALLDATGRCIRDAGLPAATSRRITAEAGVNLAAITYHFGSKDRLVAEALVEGIRAWVAPVLDALAADGEPERRVLAAVDALVGGFAGLRDQAPAYLEALVRAPRVPAVQQAVADLWTDLRRRLADQMAAMGADGELPGWVDPGPMAALVVAVANGLVLQAVVEPGGPPLPAAAAQFAALLLAARRPSQ